MPTISDTADFQTVITTFEVNPDTAQDLLEGAGAVGCRPYLA